jgi:hypothetical protein
MLWGEDPVHLYTSAYNNIAERLSDLAGSGMKPAVGKSEKVPHSKRIPVDWASWINSDAGGVTYAPRGLEAVGLALDATGGLLEDGDGNRGSPHVYCGGDSGCNKSGK